MKNLIESISVVGKVFGHASIGNFNVRNLTLFQTKKHQDLLVKASHKQKEYFNLNTKKLSNNDQRINLSADDHAALRYTAVIGSNRYSEQLLRNILNISGGLGKVACCLFTPAVSQKPQAQEAVKVKDLNQTQTPPSRSLRR